MHSRPASRRATFLALTVTGASYAIALAVLARDPDFSLVEPLFLLALLGGVFPLLAWLCTLGVSRAQIAPLHEPHQLPRVLLYLAGFTLLVLGWGFSSINAHFPGEPAQSLVQLVVKLVTMVLLPAWLFLGFGPGARATLPPQRLLLVFALMSLAYLAMQSVFGRGLVTLGELGPSAATLAWAIPLCWLWQTLEAGLCEEVLFRRVLQEKLAIATGSHVAAIAWGSLLFGLAHAPGLWLRGGHLMEGVAQASPGWALAYSIVMIAPAGIAFGVLWARTRSLWLVVPLHGMVDLLPQLAPFIRAWSGT
ncbi:CPBP family intramembrane glutamic endopeptidase [Lysobacter solisilvae (ex Woo and Kim 2020)]|uniref:CPBP family intramembrane metalloprotease n=1 Tax=Agrilutibacter terrestris TaxID=2865112 RepID=A0A7H0FVC9_9GAMM|nr:CPBP family intramembrane glutamic endopeptidase [Lysobacter terrestris]QNP39995.1 CPBP family intramembrane metalloprotease [Lysobacter terrestris]